jgi:hypothetical protein
VRRLVAVGLAVVLVAGACGSDDADTQGATPSPEPTATPVATETPEPTATPRATATAVREPTATPAPPLFFAVDDLAFDESGVLWATTGDNRSFSSGVRPGTPRHLYRLVGDVWQVVEQPVKVFDDPINWEIRAAPGGGVYLASGWDGPPSPTSGVYFTDGVNWTLFDQEFLCGSLAVDTEGQLWATCPDFLARLVDGRWVNVAEGRLAGSVAAGPDASVWFVTNTGLGENQLLRFDGTKWVTVGPCEDCFGPRSIVGVDLEGRAWVARGACGLEGITRFDPSGATENIDIRGARDAAFAEDGSVWIALPCEDAEQPAGVARFIDGDVRVFTTDDGLPANDVQAVEIGPDGTLYAGTEFGVSRYIPDTETWVPVGNL